MSSEKIGRYVIKDILGEGAMGRVYSCYDPNLERPVAIKTMRTGNLQKEDLEEFKERFAQESKVSGRLVHPNIVSIYDSGMHGNEPFLVMEYIDGTPLDAFARKNYKCVLEQFISIVGQTASGLDFAHEEEVIHRDIKPGNIMVTRSRSGKLRSKILDFGLARLQDSKITQTGFFLGTPSYASPEQVITGRVDYRSDIFSFGTVAYELLTGRLPFHAESLHAILYQIANEKPKIDFQSLSEFLDVVRLEAIFTKIFSKDPQQRYQTASSFVSDLKPVLADLPMHANTICLKRENPTTANVDNSLETALIDSSALEAASLAQKKAEAEKEKAIAQARVQFQKAFNTGNLSSIRFCLRELVHLGVDVSQEEKLVLKLENQLKEDELARRIAEKDRLIQEARKAFHLALEAKNKGSCNFCINELKALGADAQAEQQALINLEQEINKAEELAARELVVREKFRVALRARNIAGCEKILKKLQDLGLDIQWEQRAIIALQKQKEKDEIQRESWIRKVRVQFGDAVREKHLTRCRQLISELELLLKVDASKEKEAFLQLEQFIQEEETRELNRQNIENLRQQFNNDLKNRRIKNCQNVIKELELLGVNPENERQALAEERKEIAREEARNLTESMILHTREKFHKALTERNTDTARYYLKELQQLAPDSNQEKKQLDHLNAQIIKETIIRKQRIAFREAISDGNQEKAKYYLKELTLEAVDTIEEIQLLNDLNNRSHAEREILAKMVERARREFSKAMDRKDVTASEHCLHVLDDLKVDTVEETRQLAELRIASQRMPYVDEEHRTKLIKRFRRDFKQAYKAGQLEICRHHIQSLSALEADVSLERTAFEKLSSPKQEPIDQS